MFSARVIANSDGGHIRCAYLYSEVLTHCPQRSLADLARFFRTRHARLASRVPRRVTHFIPFLMVYYILLLQRAFACHRPGNQQAGICLLFVLRLRASLLDTSSLLWWATCRSIPNAHRSHRSRDKVPRAGPFLLLVSGFPFFSSLSPTLLWHMALTQPRLFPWRRRVCPW